MPISKIVVDGFKVSFLEKSNGELNEIIRNDEKSEWFEEKKLAAEEVLKKREMIEKGTTESSKKNQNKAYQSLRIPSPDIGYISSYGWARILSSLMVIIGCIVIALGAVASTLIFAEFMDRSFELKPYSFPLIASVGTILCGLFMVINGQITKAIVDSADNTGRILHMFRKLSEENVKNFSLF